MSVRCSLPAIWDGHALEWDKDELLRSLRGFPTGPCVVTVEPEFVPRSLNFNRFYFGAVVEPLAEHLGYDRAEMHEVLAMRFLRIEDCPITGVPRRRRTPGCTTPEFADYVNSCIRLAAELGVVVDSDGWAA
jgi:hypothetical protein